MSKYNPISEERKQERRNNIKKELKALIFPLVLCAIFAALVVFVMTYQETPEDDTLVEARAYEGGTDPIVLENEYLKFVMDPTSTNFDVTVKSSGKVWHSVPEGGADDPIAINEVKNKLQSSLILTYSNQAALDAPLDSHSFSAVNGIYEIQTGEDYVQIDYSLGKVAKEFVFPPVIREARFLELTGNMNKTDAENAKSNFKKIDINNLKKSDNKEELLEFYPVLETDVIYVFRDGLKDSGKKALEKTFAEAGYTYEEFVEDKALNHKEAVNDNPVFNVSVIYKLEGDDLTVEIPFSSFESRESYPIYSVTPLPYFGAGSTSDEGFLLLPEGGGSIINFNNGKTSQNIYYSNLYGWDMAVERKDLVHSTLASMNVYGISDTQDSFICIMEDGSSYASIEADISGKNSSYNYVDAIYTIKAREKYDLGAGANQDMYVYLEDLPQDESIKKRYSFIDSGDYVDMAKDYQDYLIKTYPETFTKNDETSAPLVIEAVGAVDKVKQILGVPVSRPLPLTTYEECAELITDVTNLGVDNLSVKYTGWCNGGVKQKFLKNVRLISSLGNKKDLQNLSDTAKNLGVDLYLDGITQYEFKSNLFNSGFFSYVDAAKFLSRKRAELYEYSAVTYAAREGMDSYFLLHGDTIIEMCNNLVKKTQEFGTGVSFQDLGKDLSSDFYRKDYTSRDEQMDMQVDVLKGVTAAGQKVMINEGNAYAAPYADIITNMDLRGSEYTIIDKVVPFYQIALHGYVDYTGAPINTGGNVEEQMLYAAEYGAALQFSIMKESPFTLQKTLYTMYYASEYDSWGSEMLDIYNRYNSELGHTFNQLIVDHYYITEEVHATVYEDGTKVYVNYGFEDFVDGGNTVPARDYLVVK